MISELLVDLANRGIRLKADGDRLVVDAPKGALSPDLADKIRKGKDEILVVLAELAAADIASEETLEYFGAEATGTPSLAQERQWFVDQINPESAEYNLAGAFVLLGQLNQAALDNAVSDFVKRHRLCQVCFKSNDKGLQLEDTSKPVVLNRYDFSGVGVNDTKLRNWLEETARVPFALGEEPLLRLFLIKLKEEEHLIFLVSHAIVWDAWCYDIFLSDLGKFYEAHASGKSPDLAPLAIRYEDYAFWQRRQLESERAQAARQYWIDRLNGNLNAIPLPTDRRRSNQTTNRGSRENFDIPKVLTKGLQAFALRQGATPYMVILTAFVAILARYSGTEKMVITTSVRGRNHPELEGLLGLFANRLFLCFDINRDPTFTELLSNVKQTVLDGLSYQDVPFESLLEALDVDFSHSSLFQVEFTYQNTEKRASKWGNLEVRQGPPRDFHSSHVDIGFWVRDGASFIDGAIDYRTDLYDRPTIVRLIQHFMVLLEDGLAHPDKRLSCLNLMQADEFRQLTENFGKGACHSNDSAPGPFGKVPPRPTSTDCAVICSQAEESDLVEKWLRTFVSEIVVPKQVEAICDDEWDFKLFLEQRSATLVVADANRVRGLLAVEWRPKGVCLLLPAGEVTDDILSELLAAEAEVWGYTGNIELGQIALLINYQSSDEAGLLGAPVPGMSVRVLDSNGQLVPIGVDGMVHVSSSSNIIGANRILDPVDGKPLYALNMRACWTDTGGLRCRSKTPLSHWRGKANDLKIIEQELKGLSGVRDAHVELRSHKASSPKLVAWILQDLAEPRTHSDYRISLRSRLAEHQIPDIFVRVDRLPRSQSGVVESKHLRDPFALSMAGSFEAPRAGIEAKIAQIWRAILGVERISAHDNFADLGGTSLQALRVLHEIQEQLGWQFSPRLLFFQNLRQMAERAAAAEQTKGLAA